MKAERRARRAVTLSVVMAFMADHIQGPLITTKNVSTYLQRHGFDYVSAMPTEASRVDVKAEDINTFYTRTLPEALNGTHPSLVFNMDEMGVEMFADRKDIKVFVRPHQVPSRGHLHVGIPMTRRECALVSCICLDGEA